ncbi:fasciclin-like arabinogalactan protein 2 [Chenopodium quinoa]|uniref:fasciclin-like arabinogalactan protein 2 n=1 Tax=Chenopodium quinoa TaxID=63459 RepID=UPI000B79696B|nr:fasciclin-like arabinogalactan protein 2 [Chenopodium quinoa]
MQPSMAAVVSLLLFVLLVPATTAFNITKILKAHPEFSTFNQYLTETHLANEINHLQTITILALDNSAMSSLLSKGFPTRVIRNVLSLHVLVDYYGAKKLHQITDGTTTTASLFQSSGDADGDAGYVNITDMHGGKVGFGPANTGDLNSFFVKAVLEKPYNLSIIHISQVLDSAEAEAPTPEPSKVNLTSLLSSKGCKEFSHLLTSTSAQKTFQENIESGLTVFCASDSAVKAFMPKFKNLTAGNKIAVLLYHGVPVYSSMSMLKSSNGLMNTLATEGPNKYDFTIQNDDESVTIKTKVVTAKITGTLVDEDPLAVYKLDKVLLPRELFKPSATPEPASSPEAEAPGPDAADGPASDEDDDVADSTSHKKKNNAAGLINGGGFLALGLTLCYCVLAAL